MCNKLAKLNVMANCTVIDKTQVVQKYKDLFDEIKKE